jgi:hypothetical protein
MPRPRVICLMAPVGAPDRARVERRPLGLPHEDEKRIETWGRGYPSSLSSCAGSAGFAM